MAETNEQSFTERQKSFTERQIKWLQSQCECETLDGEGHCPACGIAIVIERMSGDSRLMQTMTGAWVWAIETAPSSKVSDAMGLSMGNSHSTPHRKSQARGEG